MFGSGEEVALEFDPAGLPPLPPGWKRDYFLMADGYEKDMDFYAAEADTVEPLPFHDMGGYPSKRSYPKGDSHLNYLLQYNSRQVWRGDARSYRFDYQKPGGASTGSLRTEASSD